MIYLVKHYYPSGKMHKLTAHSAIHLARSSAKMRGNNAEIFVVDESALTLVERCGSVVPEQVPGQQPLF